MHQHDSWWMDTQKTAVFFQLKTENSRLQKTEKDCHGGGSETWFHHEFHGFLEKSLGDFENCCFFLGWIKSINVQMTKVKKSSKYKLVIYIVVSNIFFNLQPYLGKWSLIWRAYVSDGLVKNHPTRNRCVSGWMFHDKGGWIFEHKDTIFIYEFKQHKIEENTIKKHVHVEVVLSMLSISVFWVEVWWLSIWFPNNPFNATISIGSPQHDYCRLEKNRETVYTF